MSQDTTDYGWGPGVLWQGKGAEIGLTDITHGNGRWTFRLIGGVLEALAFESDPSGGWWADSCSLALRAIPKARELAAQDKLKRDLFNKTVVVTPGNLIEVHQQEPSVSLADHARALLTAIEYRIKEFGIKVEILHPVWKNTVDFLKTLANPEGSR